MSAGRARVLCQLCVVLAVMAGTSCFSHCLGLIAAHDSDAIGEQAYLHWHWTRRTEESAGREAAVEARSFHKG